MGENGNSGEWARRTAVVAGLLAAALVATLSNLAPVFAESSPSAAAELCVDTSLDPEGAVEPVRARDIDSETAARYIWSHGHHATYVAARRSHRRALAEAITTALHEVTDAEGQPGRIVPLARRAGFRVEVWHVGHERFWALVPTRDRARAHGAYIFRVGPLSTDGPEVILQAPHAYFDLHTGRVAFDWFLAPPGAHSIRAFFTNTMPRYRNGAPGDRASVRGAADVAHNPRSPFVAATVAAAEALPEAVVVQIHGFADDSVPERIGDPRTHVIVSAGTATGSTPRTALVSAALEPIAGAAVKRFPEEIKRLGATRNVVARALRERQLGSFVHVELSATLRRHLRTDPSWLARFGGALLTAAASPLALGGAAGGLAADSVLGPR